MACYEAAAAARFKTGRGGKTRSRRVQTVEVFCLQTYWGWDGLRGQEGGREGEIGRGPASERITCWGVCMVPEAASRTC